MGCRSSLLAVRWFLRNRKATAERQADGPSVVNDHKFYSKGAGPSTGKDWFDMTRGDFDFLYQEGVEGSPKMVTIALHSRLIGRPGRLSGLKQFMEHVASKPDVWVTTRADIARHWRQKYPYRGPQRLDQNGTH